MIRMRGILLLSVSLIVSACNRSQVRTPDEINYEGKKVLIVHSYHPEVSGVIEKNAGIERVLSGSGIGYEYFYMDTKRNRDEAFIQNAALKAKTAIERKRPDVVIVFDDNALKYLIMPYFRDAELPVVFAGIDWDATIYGLPYANTTGMVSVALVPQMLGYLRNFADGERIAWLGYNTLTAEKEAAAYLNILKIDMSVHRATNPDEWQQKFLELQTESDMLILSETVTAMPDWNNANVARFVTENIRIPTGCVNSAAMAFSILGLVKDLSEQGEWVADKALEIVDGKLPSDIPLTNNKVGQIMINLDLAEQLDIVFDASLLKNAQIFNVTE
jgi:hypothetical protein